MLNPDPEACRTRRSALIQFKGCLGQAATEDEVKIMCRVFCNLIGPQVMGPVWLLDSKAITKLMWSTHSITQMAFVNGLINKLPEEKSNV